PGASPFAPRDRGSSGCPEDAACHPPLRSTRDEPRPVGTFSPSVLGPVRPATAADHTPRCRRTSDHPPPPCQRWPCSGRRHAQECRDDTPCHTASRTDSWATPSLSRAAPSGVSQRFREVSGSSPISALSPLRIPLWNARPLPSTDVTRLPRYYGPIRLP